MSYQSFWYFAKRVFDMGMSFSTVTFLYVPYYLTHTRIYAYESLRSNCYKKSSQFLDGTYAHRKSLTELSSVCFLFKSQYLIFRIFLFCVHNSLNFYWIYLSASTSFIQNAIWYLLPGIHKYSILLPRLTTKSRVSEKMCKHWFTYEVLSLSTFYCVIVPVEKCCFGPSWAIDRVIFVFKPSKVDSYWQNRILIFILKII